MFYYKNGKCLIAQSTASDDPLYEQITQIEYQKIFKQNRELEQQETLSEMQETQDYIAALEEENAALLYKLLTGDDL